jgi:pyruvate kinase
VATLGPASGTQEVVGRLVSSGMDVARLNLAHGSFHDHALLVGAVREAAAAAGRPVPIWGDLPGPKLRIGRISGDAVQLATGQPFTLCAGELLGDAGSASLGLLALARLLAPGNTVYLNDGRVQLLVEEATASQVRCRVSGGGEVHSFSGVHLPGADLGPYALTAEDRACLAFAAAHRLEAVSPSFVQEAAELEAVRRAAAELGYTPALLAKIERARAVHNLDQIVASADAVVVARGDLGLDTPLEEIALLQKRILCQARRAGKPALVATHLLDSMVHHRLPTRAEVADVANAILDGACGLVLTAETALGAHPVEAVAMLARIARVTEPHLDPREACGPGQQLTI